jgi:hypothetical protein
MEGADASTTFTDSGTYTHTFTAAANAQIDTAQKKFGAASGLSDGTGDYVSAPAHPSFVPGSGDFTIDFWVRFPDVTTLKHHGLFQLYEDASNKLTLTYTGSNDTLTLTYATEGIIRFTVSDTSVGFAVDTWYHIAVIKGWGGNSATIAMTVDGVLSGTTTWGSIAINGQLDIMRVETGVSFSLNGWIDEFRFAEDTALWTEGFSVPTAASGALSVAPVSEKVELTNIIASSDDQVDTIEIWRTVGGGSSYFLLTSVANGTTSYSDNNADSILTSTELPVDNIKPYSWFDDCFGPYNASTFLLSRSQEGERGRLYYSAIGRAETMQSFINVCGDDEPLQKGVVWKGYIYLFGEGGIYQVYGANPYYSREVDPVGTTKPHTVIVTPTGIMYEGADGPRLFDGSRSVILKPDTIDLIFRGEAVENLTAFSGVVADFGRGEYFISDESQTLAYHFGRSRWRDVGLGFKSLHYAKDADILGAGTAADGIYDVEDEGTVEDNITDISIALETEHFRIGEDAGGIVKHVHIDADASSETLTIALVHDGTATTLGTLATSSRSRTTFIANKFCREFGIRITGTIDAAVNIYGADADVYESREERI